MIDDSQLREALQARAAKARIPLGDRARAVATAHPRATAGMRWRVGAWGRSVALAAIAVVVTIVVVAAFGLRSTAPDVAVGPSGSPESSVAASTPPTPDPTVAPPEPVVPWGSVTWSAGDDSLFDETGRNTFVQSAAFWNGRWIAVGFRLDLTTRHVGGHIWTSIDGQIWSRDDSWPDVQFDRIVATANRLTIVGAHRAPDVGDAPGVTRASVWTSTDGIGWAEVPLPAHESDYWVVTSAAAGGRGWLIRTFDIEGNDRWVAGDPVGGWRDVTIDPAAFAGAQVTDIVGTTDGWLAFGMSGFDRSTAEDAGPFGDPSNDSGAIWWSRDGEHWAAAEVERPGTSVIAIVSVAGGWIATGRDHGGCPSCVGSAQRLLWRSDDGHRWSPIDIDQAGEDAFASIRVESDGRRGVVFDHDSKGRLRLRETVDAVEWSDIEVFVEPSVAASVILGGGVITIGPDSILTFVDPSVRSEDYFWMVPQIGVAGTPPANAATQAPAPTSTSTDTPCAPVGQECGP